MPNPPPVPARADDALTAAARAALDASAARVVVIDHLGERYVVKRRADRPRRLPQALLLRWLVKRLTGRTLPMRSLLLSDAGSSLAYEARRLTSLAQAGVPVPAVLCQDPDFLVMEHGGETLAARLEHWPLEQACAEVEQLVTELAGFHRAGHWHGAAQIKNLTRRDGLTYRIDFEEDFGEFGPLPATQALDLVLFLNSVSLAGPIVEPEARRLLPRLVAAYFAVNPDPQVRAAMAAAMPWARALARLAAPFQGLRARGRPRKGAARVVILADALAMVLETP